MKNLIFILFLLGSINLTVSAQSEATSKGAQIISGLFSFTSQGGDLYDNFESESLTTILVSPNYLNFIIDKFAIGGAASFSRTSQGDFDFTTWRVGPKAGYFFDSGSNSIPYLGAGFNYLSIGSDGDNEGGFGYNVGGGLIIREGHLGVNIEAGFMGESYKPEGASDNITGSTIYIAIGFSGLLY